MKHGETYTFYDYTDTGENNSTWGNIKTYANGQEAWWTWIPRYAYDSSNMNKSPAEGESAIKIKFITKENKYIIEDGGTFKAGDSVTEPDIAHPAFTLKNGETIEKELCGIWMSKYEPSANYNIGTDSSSSYVKSKHYLPDLNGFDENNTYLIKYDETGTSITNGDGDLLKSVGTTDRALTQYSIDKTNGIWFDYNSKIWANVKTKANGIEAYWVWIPRYAYNLGGTSKDISIIFVDIDGKPMDKELYPDGLPDGYVVHPAFNPSEDTKLKGIWMSKYEPSNNTEIKKNTTPAKCYAPNLVGYNVDTTYIETYDENGQDIVKEYKLRDVLNKDASIDSDNILVSGKVDESKIKEGIWYNYGEQIWANVKTTANDKEAWWTWIPRYSYLTENTSRQVNIVFTKTDNTPFDEGISSDKMTLLRPHPAFTLKNGDTVEKQLEGIWMSKYEPSGAPTSEEKTLN